MKKIINGTKISGIKINGDHSTGNIKIDLIRAYYDGNVDMDDAALVVHYGNIPWDCNNDDEVNSEIMDTEITERGGWDVVRRAALESWSDLCVCDGIVVTASL
jgi:hypothetical protein